MLRRNKRSVVLVVRIDITSAAYTVSDSASTFPPLADLAVDVVVDEDLLYRDEDKSNFGRLWYGRWNCHPCGLTCGLMRCGAVRYFVSRRIRVFEPKQKPIGRKLSTVLWLSHLVFCCASFAVSDDPLLR